MLTILMNLFTAARKFGDVAEIDLVFALAISVYHTQGTIIEMLKACQVEINLDCIQLLGKMDDVAYQTIESDFDLATPRSESAGLSIFEATATGLPVVTVEVADYAADLELWVIAKCCLFELESVAHGDISVGGR